jgi:hypothetical protein
MKHIVLFILLILLVLATGRSQAYLDCNVGVISGYNNQIVGGVQVPHPTYVLFKDIVEPVRKTSLNVSLSGGYMFNHLTVFGTLIRPLDSTNPTMINGSIGWVFINRDSYENKIGLQPSLGYTQYLNDNNDIGGSLNGGIQLQFWKVAAIEGHKIFYIDYKYQYKHHIFGIGMKFSNRL